MNKVKIFGEKKITIRTINEKDLKIVKRFQDFINSLVGESAQISHNKEFSLKEERDWLKGLLKNIKKHKEVFLLAEDGDKIIGTIMINLRGERQNHVGEFGITIRMGYRGMGLGHYLMGEIIKLAKKELKPAPKILRLSVFSTNKPAISFYSRHNFKEAARIPKQIEYKGKFIDEIIMILDK